MDIKYYRTFSSYKIPFEPQSELEFRETEGLSSFYVGYQDARGRTVQFVKLLLQRNGTTAASVRAHREPGETVYFRAIRKPDEKLVAGEEIKYPETETSTEYLCGVLDASGMKAELTLVSKEQIFRDFYLYDANHKLKGRLLLRRDSQATMWRFDNKGNSHLVARASDDPAFLRLDDSSKWSLQLEVSGRNTEAASSDLVNELSSEHIPRLEVQRQAHPADASVRIGLSLAPIFAPLVVEALYGWLIGHEKSGLKIALRVGDRLADASADHFDRKEYIDLLSGIGSKAE